MRMKEISCHRPVEGKRNLSFCHCFFVVLCFTVDVQDGGKSGSRDSDLSVLNSSSKLASLFGQDRASFTGGNESLTYTAPKQPKKEKPGIMREGHRINRTCASLKLDITRGNGLTNYNVRSNVRIGTNNPTALMRNK